MCSRLLADFGAGVTFIAPADGHPLDSLGPRLPGGRSAIATYLFANKSFVTLDPDSDVGREQLLALARSADVVVSDLPPSLLASRVSNTRRLPARGSSWHTSHRTGCSARSQKCAATT